MKYLVNSPIVKELAKNGIILTLNRFFGMGVGFLASVLMAQYLGPTVLGVFLGLQALVGFVATFMNFGVHVTVTREVSRDQLKLREQFGNALGIRTFLSFPLILVISLVANSIFDFGTIDTVIMMTVFVSFTGITSLQSYAFQARNRFFSDAQVGIISRLFYIILILTALVLFSGLKSLLWAMIISQVVTFGVGAFYLRKNGLLFPFTFQFQRWKEIILTSLPVVLASSSEFINLKFDTLIISSLLNDELTGFYGAAYNLYLTIAIILYFLALSSFPTMSRFYIANTRKNFLKFVWRYAGLILFLSLTCSFLIYFGAAYLVDILYGESFLPSVAILKILVLGFPFICLNRFFIQALNASNNEKGTFKATFAGAIFNVGINLLIIPIFGIMGASITTIFTELLVLVLALYFLYRGQPKKPEINKEFELAR